MSKILKERAQQMRDNPTQAEIAFANRLEALGVRFECQRIIGHYIVDFYLIDRNLAVEIDGAIHATTRAYDERRDRYIRARGYKLTRIQNRKAWTCSMVPFGVQEPKQPKHQRRKAKKRRREDYRKSQQPGYHILDRIDDLENAKR